MVEVETGVRRIITELLGLPADRVTDAVSLADGLGMKALDRAELALEIEADFGVTIFTRPFSELRTVGDVVAYVEAALGDPAARTVQAA